jgi:hypothetical protein
VLAQKIDVQPPQRPSVDDLIFTITPPKIRGEALRMDKTLSGKAGSRAVEGPEGLLPIGALAIFVHSGQWAIAA